MSPTNPAPYVTQVTPCTTEMTFRTERRVPRLGVMLVGWGGNNGTTVTAAVLANKLGLTWRTKTGVKVGGSDTSDRNSCQAAVHDSYDAPSSSVLTTATYDETGSTELKCVVSVVGGNLKQLFKSLQIDFHTLMKWMQSTCWLEVTKTNVCYYSL